MSKVESAAKSPHYDPWLGLTDSASYTGRHPQTLREAVRSKELVASRNGDKGHYRIRLSELNRWMRSMETPARKMDPNSALSTPGLKPTRSRRQKESLPYRKSQFLFKKTSSRRLKIGFSNWNHASPVSKQHHQVTKLVTSRGIELSLANGIQGSRARAPGKR